MDPISNDFWQKGLSKTIRDNCVLNADWKKQLEDFLVQYYDMFAKPWFDEGFNTEHKVKLGPEHRLPVYVQGSPAPIQLCDGTLNELAMLKHSKIITVLSHSKMSSPIFVNANHLVRQKFLFTYTAWTIFHAMLIWGAIFQFQIQRMPQGISPMNVCSVN